MRALLLTLLALLVPTGGTRAQRSLTEATVRVGTVDVHYRAQGEGEAVVLLHGFPMTSYAWRKVMPLLADRGYRTIAPDLRGLGASGRPEAGYDAETVAGDIAGLLAALGVDRAHVVGHDLGGWVAYALAAGHPERVRSLAVVETNLPGFGLEARMNPATGGLWHFGFHMNPDLPERLVAGRERLYLAWYFARAAVPGAISPADVDIYAAHYARPGAMRAAFSYYRALPENARRNRTWAAAGKLQVPAIGVGAGRVLRAALQPDMEAIAHDARTAVVEGSGHYVPEERPETLVKVLTTFWQGMD